MLAVPTATAVTTPCDETVATPVLLELQITRRPVSVLPLPSRVVAVACELPTAVIELGLRATVTDATGTGLTVIVGVGVELMLSLVAVIVAVPTPTAVTVAGEPEALTVRTAVLLEIQVIVRPVSRFPFASLVVPVSCCVWPTIMGVVGVETVTDATPAGFTVRVAFPLFPSLVAIICVDPTPVGVTSPEGETVATAELPVLQVTARPVRMLLPASNVVAVACVVWPIWIVVADRDTLTLATGIGVTVIVDVPVFPSLVAVMTAEPTVEAVTNPVEETLATPGLSDAHATVRPVRGLLFTSLVVATSW